MKTTGIKLVCERKDEEITTWHEVFERPIEDIINSIKAQKRWIEGKFLKIYLEFDNDGKYYKVIIDHSQFNHLLKP